MKAKDIMTREVIYTHANRPVDEIARILVEKRVSGVPIVDGEMRVIGVVDESDIFLKDKGMPFSAVKMPMLFKQWVEPEKLAEIYADAHLHTAADIMERDVYCVDVEEDVTQVAFLMAQHNLERVPVVENNRLVGIISRVDIIRFYALEGKQGKTE